MARENWSQHYSNSERIVFKKGQWSLTEDGEKTWSLYYGEDCVEPVLDYNKYELLDKGFLLFRNNSIVNSYALFLESSKSPIFTISGKDVKAEVNEGLITFLNNDSATTFDKNSLLQVCLNSDNQIGLDL